MKLALVYGAGSSVFFNTMIAEQDLTGDAFADALVAAAGRGVDVRVIVDAQRTKRAFTNKLEQGGVKTIRYNPLFAFGGRRNRLHKKCLIVDLQTAIIGGLNMADDYNLGNGINHFYVDTDLLVQGDVAATAALKFLELWDSLEPNDAQVQAYLSSASGWGPTPATTTGRDGVARYVEQASDLSQYYLRDFYARCFGEAQQQVVWHVNNLSPGGPVFDGLKAAAARGVRVVLITNSVRANVRLHGWFGWFQTWWLRLTEWTRLRGTGIELWTVDIAIHSKALTVDGVMASIGSYNCSRRSDENFEAAVITHDPDVILDVELMLERHLQHATRVQ